MKLAFRTIAVAAATLLMSLPVLADWNPGDPFKMHYPQLPDPNGWDVLVRPPVFVADDFLCTETGPIAGVHLWGSFQRDLVGPLVNVHLSIHADDRTGSFSKPGALLWSRDFSPNEFTVRQWGTGDEGWLDPVDGVVLPHDHHGIYQININPITVDPFVQQQGNIYWLDVQVLSLDSLFGWKTSGSPHFEDDAVFGPGDPALWHPLVDPNTGQSLDMAFVIVPEPATLVLLMSGVIGVVALSRRVTVACACRALRRKRGSATTRLRM